MKNLVIFLTSFFALLLFVFLACEKNEQLQGEITDTTDKSTQVIDSNLVWINGPVQDRAVDSCAQCFPLSGETADCCCGIQLTSVPYPNEDAIISLCGTWDGTGNCTVSAGECTTYDGGQSKLLSLDPDEDPKVGFCMENDSVICIRNTETYAIQIFFTCQDDLANPQSVSPTIPALSTLCYTVNNQCEVTLCQ